MKKLESDCVSCEVLPCHHCESWHLYCDDCKEECEELYYNKDLQIEQCEACFDDYLEQIKEKALLDLENVSEV